MALWAGPRRAAAQAMLALLALLAALGPGAEAAGNASAAGAAREAGAARRQALQILKPACDMRTARPPVLGSMQQQRPSSGDKAEGALWEFVLEADCSYALWDAPHASMCLEGVWTVLIGASQTNIWTTQLANMLVPGTLISKRDNFSIDGVFTLMLDVVIRDGEVIYKNVVTDPNKGRVGAHTRERDVEVLRAAFAQVAKAPPFKDGDIRITNLFAEYWDNIDHGLAAVEGASEWREAEVTVAATIGLWYVNSLHCGEDSEWCATRPELGKLSHDGLLKRFRSDMALAVESLERFCSDGGRAEKRGCALASIDHCQFMQGEIWHETRDAIAQGLEGHTSPQLRYIDLWMLTMQIPEDCIGGHQSPMSTLWTWQVLLGGICDARGAAAGALAAFEGPTCRAAQVHDECPDPEARGFKFAWECGLAELCSMSVEAAPEGVRTLRVATGSVEVDFVAASRVDADSWEVEYHHSVQDYRWCLSALLVVLAALATAGARLCPAGSAPEGKRYAPLADAGDAPQHGAKAAAAAEAVEADKSGPRQDMEQHAGLPGVAGAEAEAPAPGRGAPPAAAEKFAFGLPRFAASLHVVAGHLYAKQATPDVYVFSWGFTWVPWFFLLSGFILFSAEARRPRSEPMGEYVARRAVTIYPLYAVGVLLALLVAKSRCEAPSVQALVLQAWLGQAWVPHMTEHVVQMQCWFLSCLVLYWAAFQPLFRRVSGLGLAPALGAILATLALPWLAVAVPILIGADPLWFNDHSFGHSETALDVAVVFLKFHPLCYLHVFVLGMLLGRLRLHLERFSGHRAATGLVEVMAPFGYAGLGCIFCSPALRVPAAKLSARLGVLLPLQCLVLLGMAGLPGAEPPVVASLASRLNFLEGYSYAVYVLQFVCWHLWPSDRAGVSFFLFLAAAAVVAVHAVQKPAERLARRNHGLLWAAPAALSVAVVGVSFLPAFGTCSPDLPPIVEVDSRLVDVRLPIQAYESGGSVLINPSLLFHGGGVVLAARRHRRQTELTRGTYKGEDVAVLEETWHSDIVLGTLPLDWDDWDEWLESREPPKLPKLPAWTGLRTPQGARWAHLCVRETWVPQNKTLTRLVVTGPEDPKVFLAAPTDPDAGPQVAVAFSSYPPLGRHGCGGNATVPQMYLASGVDPGDPARRSTGQHLGCGELTRAEKNWIPFEAHGQLHFVYSVLPHVVVAAYEDGSCGERHYSSFAPLVRLQGKFPGLAIRGSAQAVYVDDPDATPNLPQAHFLALLHVVDARTRRYAHFAYRFSTKPPFDILQVSSQLPLRAARAGEQGAAFAFASGLGVRDRQVIVSYAAGDHDPRIMMLTMWRLDQMFQPDNELSFHRDGAVERGMQQDEATAD